VAVNKATLASKFVVVPDSALRVHAGPLPDDVTVELVTGFTLCVSLD
jgi:hypothetical protein